MRTERRTDMTKLIVAFGNFVKGLKNLCHARNETPALQPAALKAVRRLGFPQLRSVRGSELLMAHFVILL